MPRFGIILALVLGLASHTQSAFAHGEVNDWEEDVEAMYLAYYGRPGDPEGVTYWAERLESVDGDMDEIIDAFGTSEEYTERFSTLDNETLINNIYQQLFGRDADSGGLAFYVERLESGMASLPSIALQIYDGRDGLDRVIIANKLTVAHAFTDHVEDNGLSYGSNLIDDAIALMASVDENNDSLSSAVAEITAIFDLVAASDCTQYEGSFERIQSIIFDGYNCTNSACHSSNSAGGLDLSPDVAYDNLFRVNAAANLAEPTQLVYPGEQGLSFLYQKLAAGTDGTELPTGGGAAMPVGASPLSADHLEAMRLWIRGGAPETADVDEVATLLGCSVGTPPRANKITPPDPPPLGEGIQTVSGPWTVEPNDEDEVCFATYYDLDQVAGALPDWAKTPCPTNGAFSDYEGECFAYNRRVLTQDPQSHHSIIDTYVGTTPANDPAWGTWQCLNGPSQGMACDPTQIGVPVSQGGADCGGDLYVCGTEAQSSVACSGWGPNDHRWRSVGSGGSQAPISSENFQEGVYGIAPTKGVIIWNSHAFNLSAEATTVEQYNNFWFAPEDGRDYINRAIFDAKDLLIAQVPPFTEKTYCATTTLPKGTRLTELSSHAHKRGVLWQTWLPPNDPNCRADQLGTCQPNDAAADYISRIYNDPLVLEYDPPLEYDSDDTSERTLKFCVTYDNGKNYPDLLKLASESVGSVCRLSERVCVGGALEGELCGGDDSMCGDGGVCDACPVYGGVTTEDEMFLLLGNYYVVPVE